MDLDRYADEPGSWATSLANVGEVMLDRLEAAEARSVVEVGAYAGDLTALLADWAARNDARVVAVDPSPQDPLVALADERANLELVRETSLEALPRIELPDAVVIDGDHNYWTVSEELRADRRAGAGRREPAAAAVSRRVLAPRAPGRLLDAGQIPADRRHPVAGNAGGLVPGEPGLVEGGLPYPRSAVHEGGARNGVLTAIEDFVGARDGMRLAIVPAFFGLGVAWSQSAPWSEAVAGVVEGWDQNPVVARIEANRVRLLASGSQVRSELWAAQERLARQQAVLQRLLESSAFSVAERLSRVRARAGIATTQPVVSKDEIRRALDE